MVPPYAIIFLGDLEESFFSDYDFSPLRLWQQGEKKVKKFLEILNFYYPTIKFLQIVQVRR